MAKNIIKIPTDSSTDSNALMDKGMKMLTGRCTLGLNC